MESKICFEEAKERYAAIGVDVEAALRQLRTVRLSMQCWQGDDVRGFDSESLSGGIAATGNYMGCARNAEELMADIHKAYTLIPGKHKLNLHASYRITKEKIDRDMLEPKHFAAWVDFARAEGIGLDFNPTFFSHEKASDNLTLSSPKREIRDFWITHGKACRHIAANFGQKLGMTALCNVWIPDGLKDVPGDRLEPRERLKASLDAIFAEKFPSTQILDSVEGKVFGLGVESYTVGSHEFYMNYAAKHNLMCLLDTGHYHPTEVVSDKISAMLCFHEHLALHVSRPVRWDSDHVIKFDDELKELATEIVRCKALGRVFIGLDFFDASVNRLAAWVVGMRNMQKALLYGLLSPNEQFRQWQEAQDFTNLLVGLEELKTLPFGAIWEEFCCRANVPADGQWMAEIRRYEAEVLSKR